MAVKLWTERKRGKGSLCCDGPKWISDGADADEAGGVGAAAENDRYCDILCTEVDIGGTDAADSLDICDTIADAIGQLQK